MEKNRIKRADVLTMSDFAKIRQAKRQELVAMKKDRRVSVGPDATFYFENWHTMWFQIHEMLFIEQGGVAQVAGELDSYNPMIPNGCELVATLMFEVDDPKRRSKLLETLGGVEETVTLEFAGHVIAAKAETDLDRTTAGGKASSVQFLHFPFTQMEVTAFCSLTNQVLISFGHPNYRHMAVLRRAVQKSLSNDFDLTA